MAVSAALAGLTIAAIAVFPPLGIAAAIGLGLASFAASNAYSAVTSFVAICNPNAKAVLQEIDDIRNGINGRPTELSKMKRENDKRLHEEILDHLKGKKPLYQEDFFSKNSAIDDDKFLAKLDTMISNAKNKKDEARVTNLSLLQKTLKTVIAGEKECNHRENDKDLLSNQMVFPMSV